MRTMGRHAAMLAVLAAGLAMGVPDEVQPPPRPRGRTGADGPEPKMPERTTSPEPYRDPKLEAEVARLREDRKARKAANWAKRQPKH